MKCRAKSPIKIDKIKIPKNQTGYIKGTVWGETSKKYPNLDLKDGQFYYLVDFPEGKDLVVSTRDVDLE